MHFPMSTKKYTRETLHQNNIASTWLASHCFFLSSRDLSPEWRAPPSRKSAASYLAHGSMAAVAISLISDK